MCLFIFNQHPPPLPPFVFWKSCCLSPDEMGLLTNNLHLLLVYLKIAPEPRPKKNRELVTDILPLSKDSLDTV